MKEFLSSYVLRNADSIKHIYNNNGEPVGFRVTGMIPHCVMQKSANGHRKKVGTVYRYGSQDYYYWRNRKKVMDFCRSSLKNQ